MRKVLEPCKWYNNLQFDQIKAMSNFEALLGVDARNTSTNTAQYTFEILGDGESLIAKVLKLLKFRLCKMCNVNVPVKDVKR